MVVGVSVAILVVLFCVQRFGTDKVGYSFAPAISIWFTCIALIGVYNIVKFDPTIFKAFNPYYIYTFFKRNKHDGWVSLGGVVLAITGLHHSKNHASNHTHRVRIIHKTPQLK